MRQIFILMVFRHGHLLAESYLKDDSHLSHPQMIWSCTKQFMGILTGIALEEGVISSLDDPMAKYLSGVEENHPDKIDIPIRQLITMHSGNDYNNDGAGGETDKVLREIPDDLSSFVLSRPMREDPGKPTDQWANEAWYSFYVGTWRPICLYSSC